MLALVWGFIGETESWGGDWIFELLILRMARTVRREKTINHTTIGSAPLGIEPNMNQMPTPQTRSTSNISSNAVGLEFSPMMLGMYYGNFIMISASRHQYYNRSDLKVAEHVSFVFIAT